jgi:hypothetical protein
MHKLNRPLEPQSFTKAVKIVKEERPVDKFTGGRRCEYFRDTQVDAYHYLKIANFSTRS